MIRGGVIYQPDHNNGDLLDLGCKLHDKGFEFSGFRAWTNALGPKCNINITSCLIRYQTVDELIESPTIAAPITFPANRCQVWSVVLLAEQSAIRRQSTQYYPNKSRVPSRANLFRTDSFASCSKLASWNHDAPCCWGPKYCQRDRLPWVSSYGIRFINGAPSIRSTIYRD